MESREGHLAAHSNLCQPTLIYPQFYPAVLLPRCLCVCQPQHTETPPETQVTGLNCLEAATMCPQSYTV